MFYNRKFLYFPTMEIIINCIVQRGAVNAVPFLPISVNLVSKEGWLEHTAIVVWQVSDSTKGMEHENRKNRNCRGTYSPEDAL